MCKLPVCLLFFTVLLLAACQKPPAIQPSGKRITIGIIAPLSGDDAAMGRNGLHGIEAAQWLRPMLQNGDRIELLVMDDVNDPPRLQQRLDELAGREDRPRALILLSDSQAVLAAMPRIRELAIPSVAAFATSARIPGDNGYLVQAGIDDAFQGMVAALFVHDELLLDKVAIVSQAGSPYSSDLARQFEEKFLAVRGTVTGHRQLNGKQDDLDSLLDQLRRQQPQLIYLPLHSRLALPLLRRLKQTDWRPAVLTSDSFFRHVFHDPRHNGLLPTRVMSTAMYSPDDAFSGAGQEIRKHYEQKHGRFGSHAMLAAEAYLLVVQAMNNCEVPGNRQCLRQQLHDIQGMTGIQNRIFIGNDGKAARPLYVNRLEDSNIIMQVKVY